MGSLVTHPVPPGSFPVAERLASRILSLPIYPGMAPEVQDRVIDAVHAALRAVNAPA